MNGVGRSCSHVAVLENLLAREVGFGQPRALVADGDIAGAKERVRWASELWPPIRLEMLDDPALEGI